MHTDVLIGLTAILVLGIGAQWVAWKVHLPSILLLLIAGFVAGPITGWLAPDVLLGPILFPFVSLSVAVILFEGGLSLDLRELREIGPAVRNLVTIGVGVTWVLTTLAAYYILEFPLGLALLLGAILVVTGPTVIIPLLLYLRPKGRVGRVARWEGIVNDPIGALLAVLVFEVLMGTGLEAHTPSVHTLRQLLMSVFIGVGAGLTGAFLLRLLLLRYLVPDFLVNSVVLMAVVLDYVVSDMLQPESGLIAVTIMGIALANQRDLPVRDIVAFKEELRVLLIGSLFIILAARLTLDAIMLLEWRSLIFLGLLILVVRPLAVWFSLWRTSLEPRERVFLMGLAPRGIVAAAVASIFAERLMAQGITEAALLTPVTFLVVAGTVAVYGLGAGPLARWLKLAEPDPQGVLMLGAHTWARKLALELQKWGIQVILVDANAAHVRMARKQGLQAYHGNVLAEELEERIDLDGIGYFLALTSNDEVNSLAVLHFRDVFGRSRVFQLVPELGEEVPAHLRGRLLFAEEATYSYLTRRFREGHRLVTIEVEESMTLEKVKAQFGEEALALFARTDDGKLLIFDVHNPPVLEPRMQVLLLVNPQDIPEETKPETS